MPGNAERRETLKAPVGKKVAKKRRQAGLVADGRRASPRTNVSLRSRPACGREKGPSCRFSCRGPCLIALCAGPLSRTGRVEPGHHDPAPFQPAKNLKNNTLQTLEKQLQYPREHTILFLMTSLIHIRRACRPYEATAATDRSAACTAQERTQYSSARTADRHARGDPSLVEPSAAWSQRE